MEQLKKLGFAVVGAGELAVQSAKDFGSQAQSFAGKSRRQAVAQYKGLSRRGERIVSKVRRSGPAQQAINGTKQARKQLKGAVTGLRKAGTDERRPSKSA